MQSKKCAGCKKESCEGCRLQQGWDFHSNKKKQIVFPQGFVKEKKQGYGMVFDIGTTTVAATLWDLESGDMLAADVQANPQSVAGSDVAGRIAYGIQSLKNARYLQIILVEILDEMADRLWRNTKGSSPIEEAIVVGNTAMCEIFLGLSLRGLAGAPFEAAYQGCVYKKGAELSFSFLSDTRITVLPAVGGYVGADALSVYTYVKKIDNRDNILAVDIGTNGEILLMGKERVFACSAPAGPALEGAAVLQGMCAVPGAIEMVGMAGVFPRQDIACKVIGDVSARGICGSGLIDALALLVQLQVVTPDGYLRSESEAREAGVCERICRRIQEADGERSFLLTQMEEPICLTAGDIRQLQLAKGAICGAIQVLMQKAEVLKEDISHLYLAGSFGSYIQVESALSIGLLPQIDKTRITHVGNCAMAGGAMALFSQAVVGEMEKSAVQLQHVELANEADFEKLFLQSMALC